MNLALPTGPLAQAIGWALLHVLWQGAVVAALLAVLLAFLSGRSATLRYAVSCAALGLIVALGVATAFRSYPAGMAAAPVAKALLTHPTAPATAAIATARPDRIRSWARAANDALPTIVTLWLVGVALFSLRLILEWLRARRLVTRNASRARESWQAAARRLSLALGVRRAVQLLESAAVEVPSVIGFVRPAILLPASTLTGLTPAQLEMILAHELAHIRRHDLLVNLLQAVVETLLFYHPAVWWISRRIRIERENCCDDLAVAVCGNPLQYARALTRLEELRARALPVAVSANDGSLLMRIKRIAGGSTGATGHAVRGVAALVLLSCVLLAVAAPSLPAFGQLEPIVKRVRGAAARIERSTSRPTRTDEANRNRGGAAFVAPAPRPSDLASDVSDSEVASPDADPSTEGESDTDAESWPDFGPGRGRLTLDEIIELRAQNVTPAVIREMRSLFPRIDAKEIAGMSAVGATPEYVREMRKAGLEVRTARDAQGLAALGVTVAFIRDIRSAGLAVESAKEAQGLAAVGVTSMFIRDMRTAGLAVESAKEAQGLAAVGVTAAFIRGIRSAGLEIESAKEAQGLAALGVTPEFIRNLRAAGIAVESASEAQGLAGVGVTPDYVRSLRAAGIALGSASEAQALAGVGVTPDYVRGLRDAGVDVSDAGDAQTLRALNITPEFVKHLAKAGYRNLTVKDLSRLGASGLTGDFVREMSKYKSR